MEGIDDSFLKARYSKCHFFVAYHIPFFVLIKKIILLHRKTQNYSPFIPVT